MDEGEFKMTRVEFIRELVMTSSIDPETGSRRLRLRAAKELTDNIIDDPEKWIKMIQSLAAQKEPQYIATFSTDTCWWKISGNYFKVAHAINRAKTLLLKRDKPLIIIKFYNPEGSTIYSFYKENNLLESGSQL
jgi:hypothetical protein